MPTVQDVVWKKVGAYVAVDLEAIERRLQSLDIKAAADQLMKATVPLAIPALPPAPEPIRRHVPHLRHSTYMDTVDTKHLTHKVELACRALRDYEFDAVAFRGMSGALVAPSVAMQLSKSMLMVRKPHDDSHAQRYENCLVEGDAGVRTYIIVDDFIAGGGTVRAIQSAIKTFAPNAQCLGTLEVRYLRSTDFPGRIALNDLGCK